MRQEYTIYRVDTGEILGVAGTANPDAHCVSENIGWVLGRSNDVTQYVSDGVVTDKPTMSFTLSGATLSDLPIPCTLTIEDTTYVIDDGVAELELGNGRFLIRVSSFPYIDEEVIIES